MGVEKPEAPSIALPPVLEDIKVRNPGGPPPMPLPKHGGGFPMAKHRTEKRYARRDRAPRAKSTASEEVWDTGVMQSDPLPDKVLEASMLEDNSLVAAAAVMLRSRNSSQRNACLSKLLAEQDLAQEVAVSDPTVIAQFVLALRLALDADSLTQQADVIRVLERVTERKNEATWHKLLQLMSSTGRCTSLSSWYEERTMFGLGECKLTQPTDPIANVPKAKLWEPIESIHELSSVAQCELLDTIAKTQYSTRLRYLLTHPNEAAPWVPNTILNIFMHLSLSRSAAEALSAAPKLLETLIATVSPAVTDHGIAALSESALVTLANIVKASPEAAQIIKEHEAFPKAISVLVASVEAAKGKIEGRLLTHAQAALMFLRTGLHSGQCSKHLIISIFGPLCVLVRAGVTEAVLVLEAHGMVHGLSETLEGKQQVGLIDFALRDLPPLLVAKSKAEGTSGTYKTFASACLRFMAQAAEVFPTTVTNLELLVATIRMLLPTFQVSVDYSLLLREFPAASASQLNCVRWEQHTPEVEAQIIEAAWCSSTLGFLRCLAKKDAVVSTVAAAGLEEVVGKVEIPREVVAGLGEAAVRHSLLPKRDSRMNAAALQPLVKVAITVSGIRKLKGTALNLSLFLQPSDGLLFTELLDTVLEGYPALKHYFSGAYAQQLSMSEPLFMRYTPGRLEPQLEWLFVIVVDVPEDEAEGRMLTVQTKHGADSVAQREWGAWLSTIVSDEATFLLKLDWREALLRSAGIFNEEGTYLSLLPYLARVVEKRTVREGRWDTRMGESPIQALKRFLHEYESAGGGDKVSSAVCLLFLDECFGRDFKRAVMEVMGSVLLCHMAGTCFGEGDINGLFLGLAAYFGAEEVEADEAREAALMITARDLNPANLLHICAVHKLAGYLFEDDHSLAFMASDIIEVLTPKALYHVTLYQHSCEAAAATGASALGGYLQASLLDVSTEAAQQRIAAVKALGLPACKVFN